VTVSELGEHALVSRIRARLSPPRRDVVIGIGDDAAVVTGARNAHAVLTVDALVEGVHFKRRWSSPGDVGHKALAVNLSDLAAMGAEPQWALLSLIVPGAHVVDEIDGLVDGLSALAAVHGVSVVGGNVARTDGPLIVDVTAIGAVRPRRMLRRSGGRPGDELYVTGTLGGAAAGLEMLASGDTASDAERAACVARHRRPEPRVRTGLAMSRARAARAAMDLSDGLADAVRQIAAESGCGAIVEADALPIEPGARRWWTDSAREVTIAALVGGEDYELLFAVPPAWKGRLRAARQRAASPPLTRIGRLTSDPGVMILAREGRREPLPAGFEHFRC
jgi:thiamine-monophosphate kinase